MEKLRSAITSICPHLQIKLSDAKILSEDEIVFLFHASENIEPLFDMLKKYNIDTELDSVEDQKFLFIFF
jgi:hypothetical protein